MIKLRCLTIICLCAITLISCNKQIPETGDTSKEIHTNPISFVSTYSTDNAQNIINNISIYCFSQKPGTTTYTYETHIKDMQPQASTDGLQISLTLDGTLPRIFYAVANENNKLNHPTLNAQTTAEQFEQNSYIVNQNKPDAPYILIAKNILQNPQLKNAISAEFTQIAACLDINNKFSGFEVDSIVLNNTKNGMTLFQNTTSSNTFQSTNINYGNATELAVYPVENAFLAVYGKYNNIKTVFDIPLIDIKVATRYRVTFKGINDQSFDFSSNLTWNVEMWSAGNNVETNPDWVKL